jgi:hypothetical protein
MDGVLRVVAIADFNSAESFNLQRLLVLKFSIFMAWRRITYQYRIAITRHGFSHNFIPLWLDSGSHASMTNFCRWLKQLANRELECFRHC